VVVQGNFQNIATVESREFEPPRDRENRESIGEGDEIGSSY